MEIFSENGTKEINGTQLYYKVVGSGEPILIINGGPKKRTFLQSRRLLL